ncbi:MAG TPA: hypothetical protein VIJ17_02120 [Pseudolabrys sp.]
MADDSGRPEGGTAKPGIFISYSHKDEPEKPGPDGKRKFAELPPRV